MTTARVSTPSHHGGYPPLLQRIARAVRPRSPRHRLDPRPAAPALSPETVPMPVAAHLAAVVRAGAR